MKCKPLKDVAQIIMGQSPDSSSYNEVGEGFPFFQGNADFGVMYPSERIWCNQPKKIANENDILISVRAPIGALNYANKKCCIGRGLAAITVNNPVERNYIFHLLKAKNAELNRKGTGSTFKAIGKNVLEDIPVPIVSSEIQLHITRLMDITESIISKRKNELKYYDELIKARFVEMFGDLRANPFGFKKKKLKDTCIVITGNTPSRSVPEYYGDYMEWIKTDNIVTGFLNPTKSVEYLSEAGVNVGRTVEKDSILMSCIAGSVASIGRVCITNRKVAFNQQINAVIPKEYDVLFLYVMLQMSKDYLTEEINMALKGILSKSKLEEKEFVIPPIKQQKQFATFVTQVDKSKVMKRLRLSTNSFC